MKKLAIPSKGEFFYVTVDDDDFPVLSRHKWYILFSGKLQRPYAFTRFYTEQDTKNGKTFLMHHMIMGTSGAVDHVNNDSLDNRKENLRVATYQENGWNKGKPNRKAGTTSRFKGVSYAPLKGRDRWMVVISLGRGKGVERVGYFFDEVEAAKAYNKRVVEMRGQYAWVNPLPDVNQQA